MKTKIKKKIKHWFFHSWSSWSDCPINAQVKTCKICNKKRVRFI